MPAVTDSRTHGNGIKRPCCAPGKVQKHCFLPHNCPPRARWSLLPARSQSGSIATGEQDPEVELAAAAVVSHVLLGVPEHSQYIKGIAAQPEHLGALLKVLQAQNQEIVSPSDRSNLHPLVIPLTVQQPTHGKSDPVYTCLLRKATLSTASEQVMPVVQMSRGSQYLDLAARNTAEYLHRALAQEDVASGPGAIAEAAGQSSQQLYSQGDAADNLFAYLTRKAGMYPDVAEQLVANHLQKGDTMSALITSEWYTRPTHFLGWGRPYEFTAGLYKQLGRHEEARDSARVALTLPWWSLSTGFAAVRQMAGLQGDASAVHRALKEQTYAVNGALPPGATAAKDDRQVFIEDAEFLMNQAAAGELSWDEIRPQLADKYAQAGLREVANFVNAN